MKVYLIDDDSEESDLFNEALKQVDDRIEFKWFDNAKEALDFILVQSPMPDIIFLDLNLPEVSGKQFLKLLRANPVSETVPVVIYSTSITKRDIDETSSNNVASYLQKPENFQTMYSKLSELIADIKNPQA